MRSTPTFRCESTRQQSADVFPLDTEARTVVEKGKKGLHRDYGFDLRLGREQENEKMPR